MIKLTKTQKNVLEAAIGHLNGSIHPLPANIRGGAAQKVIQGLLQRGLVEEDGYQSWRITEKGFNAIGIRFAGEEDPGLEADVALAEKSFSRSCVAR